MTTLATLAASAHAEPPAPFDLAGPVLEAKVTRGALTLPVAQVPNLAPGDQLWIKADLPSSQSAHYLLVAAFLRGSTNPPPADWFYRCETWSGACSKDGLTLTVPSDAQQLLVFLAPQTSGDFKTLINAVRGRPGAFVRASQDLNQATLDRSRLESYLAAIHQLDSADPARLKDAAPLLARSLAIKVDEKCLDRIAELQASCLTSNRDALILNDGHSTSIVEALTAGPASDLAMEASYTPQLNYGYYSPYIASVLDIARILDSFHTAQYQYIPALTSQHGDQLALTLNTPPSFHNPKSVLVVALPAVEQPQLPPLHAVDPKQIYCARKSTPVLPVEGAPLVFSTGYAHDMTLTLSASGGQTIDLPAHADAQQGGFVVDTSALANTTLGDSVQGSLHGYWGFDQYQGPSFELESAHAQSWQLAAGDQSALIVGREDVVHLQASSVSCVDDVRITDANGEPVPTEWKAVKPGEMELKLPLQQAKPGALTLVVGQYGGSHPQPMQLQAFAEAAHLTGFAYHVGDAQGTLKGSRLDEVADLTLKGVAFVPTKLTSLQGNDELALVAQDAASLASLRQGDVAHAKVTLKDGREFDLNATVQAPRPRVMLLGKSVQPSAASADNAIQLANQDELPQDAKLSFSLRSQLPSAFSADEKIEVASADGSASTTLSFANGGIILADASVAVATLDPAKAFGNSVFGPLQFRVVGSDADSDWQPLATLVRLPALRDVKCPATPDLACKLSGSNLFLVVAVASDSKFDHAVQVPEGFPGYTLPVPRPTDGQLYIKLRDDPSVINPALLGVQDLPPTPNEVARAAARHAAASPDLVGSPATAVPIERPDPAATPTSIAAPASSLQAVPPSGAAPSAPAAAAVPGLPQN